MVFDEPPAPAARVELGFKTVLPVARRLTRKELFNALAHHTLQTMTYRMLAPGGLATPEAERPVREVFGASESD